MIVKVNALQSMFSLICCVFFPPHFPQQRQQQKQMPETQKPQASSPPMMVTIISPTHQVANCKTVPHITGSTCTGGLKGRGSGHMQGEWSCEGGAGGDVTSYTHTA